MIEMENHTKYKGKEYLTFSQVEKAMNNIWKYTGERIYKTTLYNRFYRSQRPDWYGIEEIEKNGKKVKAISAETFQNLWLKGGRIRKWNAIPRAERR